MPIVGGYYSNPVFKGGAVIKRATAVDGNLNRCFFDVKLYYEQLKKRGVLLPDVEFEQRGDYFEMQMQYIKSLRLTGRIVSDVFDLLLHGSLDIWKRSSLSCLDETLKLISSDERIMIAGIDPNPTNFILGEAGAYLVDLFPPRLLRDSEGKAVSEPLIDYPEVIAGYPSDPEILEFKLRNLREGFYTTKGLAKRFAAWYSAVSTIHGEDYAPYAKIILDYLKEKGFPKLSDSLQGDFDSGELFKLVEYLRNIAIKRAEARNNTLVLAVAGISRRARDKLGMNKVVYPVHGKPLLQHIIEAMRKNIGVDHIVYAIREDGKSQDVIGFAEEYARSSGLPSTFAPHNPRGVGAAYIAGMENAPGGNVILSIGDSIGSDYSTYGDLPHDIIRAGTPGQIGAEKKRKTVNVDGIDLGLCSPTFVSSNARKRLMELVQVKLDNMENHPEILDHQGEIALEWMIDSLIEEGFSVGYSNIGTLAEMNRAEDIEALERIVK